MQETADLPLNHPSYEALNKMPRQRFVDGPVLCEFPVGHTMRHVDRTGDMEDSLTFLAPSRSVHGVQDSCSLTPSLTRLRPQSMVLRVKSGLPKPECGAELAPLVLGRVSGVPRSLGGKGHPWPMTGPQPTLNVRPIAV